MKKPLLPLLLTYSIVSLSANSYTTQENNLTIENNSSQQIKIERMKKEVEEQMKREEKYAKEQRFYQGDEYNLSAVEVNQDSIDSTPLIEPDYDFEIDDVYRDDI
jgi:hypothetical protein